MLIKTVGLAMGLTLALASGVCILSCSGATASAQQVRQGDSPLSPFGISGDEHTSRDLPAWIPQMAALGIKNMRACRTAWANVEPEKGRWTWEEMDNQLSYMANNHLECSGFLYVYRGMPWNPKGIKNFFPVDNLPEWSNYVSNVVRHADGKIRYWEVWNEPPNNTGRNQTPADYARVLVSAYDAAKAADPNSMIGMAAQSVNLNYLDRAIKAGAKDHFDFITLHPYEDLGNVMEKDDTEAVFMSIVPTVRKMLAAQDPSRINVPIWFTEIGYLASKGADLQADAVIKAYTMGIAQGVAVIDWFEGKDGDSGPLGLLDASGAPRPSYIAMAQLIKHLGSHPTYLGWVLLNHKDYGFVFQGSRENVLVAWAPRGTSDHVKFGCNVHVLNPLSGQIRIADNYDLTNSPVLILQVPDKLVMQAKGNENRSFPWGGDYTRAESISVVMGKSVREKGLHIREGKSIAANVIAYGGSARSGDAPGGVVFMVDPNFLSYTTTPIKITAVVRRAHANDPASLNIEYESTSGFKKADPHEIPNNSAWHTVTWRIDDPQFVSKWGFNFRFDSGKYFLKSVTVSKCADGTSSCGPRAR